MSKENKESLSYKDAGVDIEQASALVEDIKTIAKRTSRPGVMKGIGGFGAMFEIPTERFKKPVLVSSTDGVGTKLKLAIEMNKHDTIGIDLVAMCVNDLITLGAEPLFFLDYFATGKLNPAQARDIIAGIGKGCELASSALIGGETAEMPGMYHDEDYDLAGFSVGAVEKEHIIDGSKVSAGDAIIALASSGPHSNGYSLIRKVVERGKHSWDEPFEDNTLGEALLTPTRIYVQTILQLCKKIDVHAIAHVTGGGIVENLPRVLPENTKADIDVDSWTWPSIFRWLQDKGNIAIHNMFETFNLGVGMVVIVDANDCEATLQQLKALGETAWKLGEVIPAAEKNPSVLMD